MPISTRTISKLAAPKDLIHLGKSVAMLDAIVFPDDWDVRYHSFDAKWGRGEQVFSMRNGEGDFWFLLFAKTGAALHGFAHESPMSPWSKERAKEKDGPKPFAGIFDGFPKSAGYTETAKSFCEDPNEVTFCAWWTKSGPWRIGPVKFPKGKDPDGSEDLLFVLDGKPETYANWIKGYAEPIALPHVKKIYAHEPLTKALVAAINPEASFVDVAKEAKTIGYAVAVAR
jgi:hypothetical protein